MIGNKDQTRRDFLGIVGGSVALSGLAGVGAATSDSADDERSGATGGELLADVGADYGVEGVSRRIEREYDAATVVHSNDGLGYVAVDVAGDGDEQRVANALEGMDGIVHVERNVRAKAIDPVGTGPFDSTFDAGTADATEAVEGYEPNDRLFDQQYAPRKVDAPAAWETTVGGDVDVAVLDTGVDLDHPQLDGQILNPAGKDFVGERDEPTPTSDGEQHGTWVAGTLAAQIDDGSGTAGICDANLFVGRVLDSDAYGVTSDVADGIQWAVDQGADVINMSLQFPSSRQLENAVEYALARDVCLVACSGNRGESRDQVSHPARYDGVIAVGATDRSDAVTDFSQTGPNLSVVAPGKDVLAPSTRDGDYEGHQRWWGTSAATPIVTGIVGLALSIAPDSSPDQLYELVVNGAESLGLDERRQGAGLANAGNTVDLANGQFPDVVGHPFQPAIESLVDDGVISGYPDGTFRPERALTRAEFATMIANAFQLDPDQRPDFTDVRGHWAEDQIRTVAGAGFFGGYPDGTFRPDQSISKAEVIVALDSGLGYSGGDTGALDEAYEDAKFVPDWARQAFADAHRAWGGIDNYPDEDVLGPEYDATRAEAAEYVYEATRADGIQAATASGSRVETLEGTVERSAPATHEYAVRGSGEVRLTLDGPADADLDLYVTLDGREPSRSDYDRAARSYGSHEELVVDAGSIDGLGILVTAYAGGGAYELRIEDLG